MVHIPRAVYKAIYAYLFRNGSLALKEYGRVGEVQAITYINSDGEKCAAKYLHVNCVLKSLESREYVRDTYAWRHHYYFLTEKGENFIRSELDLTDDIKPTPFTKKIVEREIPERPERPSRGPRRSN